MVSYGTDIPVADKPKYVLFVLGNVKDICYLCRVKDHDYDANSFQYRELDEKFIKNVPDWYKEVPHKTWFLFDSMQQIPIDFLEQLLSAQSGASVAEFIKARANNKKIY